MEYTKGKWNARYSGEKEQPYYIETDDKTIAHLWGLRDITEVKANAHLIAAAPLMYEALKDFSQYWTPEKILTTPPSLFSKLRQILAKVEGGK